MRRIPRKNTLFVVCAILMAAVPAQAASLAINEVMASNSATKADPQGQYDDWIEVYNYGDTPIDIGGMYLTDDPNEPTRWQIPAADPGLTTIAAGGYLLIWADGDTEAEGLHADFKLSSGGEELALFGVDGVILIDSLAFPELSADVSYGRYPDAGDALRYFVAPTPGAANQEGYEGLVGRVEFSRERGFCEEPFSLTLSTDTPDATIYYSLDYELPG
ncbi:MAG: lamin tail domain-containing protein, partial [Solirubrobacterales bacterium]